MATQLLGGPVLLAEHDTMVAKDAIRIVKEELGLAEVVVWLKRGPDVIGFIRRLNADAANAQAMPALVMLNLLSPVAGMEAMHALRDGPATRFLPVIIVAASEEEQALIKDYLTGSNSCITRPLTRAKFASAMKRLGLQLEK